MMTKSSNLILNLNLILGFFWVSLGFVGLFWVSLGLKKTQKNRLGFFDFEKSGAYAPPETTLEITSLPANR